MPGRDQLTRLLRRSLVLLALLTLAAGTSGDVPSLLERAGSDSAYASGATTTTSTTSTTAPPPTTTTTPPDPEWVVFAVGDVLMERSEAAGRDPFDQVVPPLHEPDLAIVNIEMAIAESGSPEEGKEFTFRAPPSAAETLAAAGVDVGNLGNNHSLDYGRDALLETIVNLRDAGVAPVGAGADPGEAYAPAVFEIGGRGDGDGSGDHGSDTAVVSVAVIGISQVVPAGWMVGALPGIATDRDDAHLEAVRAAAETHDVVLVTVHWGAEGAPCPSDRQIALGDDLVDAGASAVLGHHPHVLQPVIERGGGLIAYSLGNFVFGPRQGPQGETGVLELRFRGDRFTGFTLHPHRLDENGEPEPADSETARRIEEAVARDCDGL